MSPGHLAGLFTLGGGRLFGIAYLFLALTATAALIKPVSVVLPPLIEWCRPHVKTLEDMLRHIYLIAATGSGKTSKILSDIYLPWVTGTYTPGFKPGCLIIETKDRETIDDILNCTPQSEHDRIIVFDPYDMYCHERFIGLNVIEKNYELRTVKTLVGGETISVFQRQWEGYIGPSSEDIIRNITLANLDMDNATILENYLAIKDEIYREQLTENIKNPILRNYFETFPEPEKHGNLFNPPLNKLRSFLTDDLALHILAQAKGLNIRRAIEEGKIVLFCLPKGLIGEPLSRLLASIALSKAQLAAFSRANMPKSERLKRPFMVIADEFQDYCNSSFNVFLEQARSMGISLVISHQLLTQKGIDDSMIQSIFGNVGTKYVGACGVNDAPKLAKEMMTGQDPEPFNVHKLINLPNFTFVCKELCNGKRLKPRLVKTPVPPKKNKNARLLRLISLEKYGVQKEDIAENLKWRLGIVDEETETSRTKEPESA